MIPDFVHDIRAREPQRAKLGQAVEQYLAAGGSIATLPYLAPRELTRYDDLDSAIMAGTMKEPMAKVPAGIRQVWIHAGVIIDLEQAAA